MKTAIYARKSTNKSGQKDTIENQIKICKRYAADNGLEIVDVKMDSASGTDDLNRPEVRELITDAVKGNYDCVIMKGISRLYRDTEKGLGLVKKLDRSNIRVITVEEGFDSFEQRAGNELDTSRITMYLMFAEMESKKLSDRIKHTQIEKAHAGEWNQASSVPIGMKYNPLTKKLEIDPSTALIVELIFSLYMEGRGTKNIAHYLNGENPDGQIYPSPKSKRWSEYTVGFILKNQVYIGNLVYNKRSKKKRPYKNPEILGKTFDDVYVGNDYNDKEKWITVENAHPAIIDAETFEKVQAILLTKAKRKGVRNNVSLFASIAVCAKCGKGMTFKRGRKNDKGQVVTADNYYCMNYIRYGKQYCTSHHVRADHLEQVVFEDISELLKHPERIDALYSEFKSKINAGSGDNEKIIRDTEKEIVKITNLMDKLLQKNLEGDIDDNQYRTMNSNYSEKLNLLTTQIADLKIKMEAKNEHEATLKKFKNDIRGIDNFKNKTTEEKRYVLLNLIDKAIVDGDTGAIEMRYKFENPQS